MSKGFENISGKGTGGGGELPEMEDIGKPAPFFGLLILAVGLPQLLRYCCGPTSVASVQLLAFQIIRP